MLRKWSAVVLALLAVPALALAQGTGKVAGTVTDATTGEALPGAAVQLLGTTLGTATNLDGNYYIIGVPVGATDVQASFVGYQTETVTGVEVSTGYTRELNFALQPVRLMMNPVRAQTPEEEVRATIDRLFDGMRAGDGTMVASVFHEGATLGRATDTGFRRSSIEGFVQAVGAPHEQVWDEKIWDVKIHIDGRLATAWMEFAFFLGDTLSHCGVNAMTLYKADDAWKIVHLEDTNRGKECDLPADLRP